MTKSPIYKITVKQGMFDRTHHIFHTLSESERFVKEKLKSGCKIEIVKQH